MRDAGEIEGKKMYDKQKWIESRNRKMLGKENKFGEQCESTSRLVLLI